MNFKFIFIAFFFLICGVSTTLAQGTAFENSVHHFHTKLPEGWQQSDPISSRFFEFVHPESIATLSITVHNFEEVVTLNAFKQQHVTSRYDGWQNLFERAGTQLEAFRAGASESHVAVYGKTILDNKLNATQKIIGEYYFLKDGKKGYVLTVQSYKTHWKEIQGDVKVFVDSFWVGLEKQKIFYSPDNTAPIIQTSYLNALISPQSVNTTINIQHVISDFSDEIHFSEISNELLYFNSRQLAAFFPLNPSQNWQLQTDKPIISNVLHQDTLSMTIVAGKQKLIRIFFRNSGLVYKEIPLQSKHISNLAFYGDYIFLIEDENLIAYHIHTGRKELEIVGPFNPKFTPIITQQSVFIEHKNENILCYALNTQSLKWTYTPPAPIVKIIIDPTLGAFIATTQKIDRLDVNTGTPIPTALSEPINPTRTISTIHLAKDVLVSVINTEENKNEINAYVASSGEKLWSYDDHLGQVQGIKNQTYISPQFIWINLKDRLLVLDINTGVETSFDHLNFQDSQDSIHSLQVINNNIYLIIYTKNQSKYAIAQI